MIVDFFKELVFQSPLKEVFFLNKHEDNIRLAVPLAFVVHLSLTRKQIFINIFNINEFIDVIPIVAVN